MIMRCVLAVLTAATATAQTLPNILFICTDDQAAWAFSASGNRDAYTPNMDRLAAEGAVLENCFVVTPVCSPSRVAMLASRYGTEVGITDWINPRGGTNQRNEADLGLDPAIPTWVRTLQQAGYGTALIGKWHLGTRDEYHPTKFGYGRFVGFRAGGIAPENPRIEVDFEEHELGGLAVDIITDHAIAQLESFAKNPAAPFALSVHYREPHAPYLPVAERDWTRFKDLDPKLPEDAGADLDTERAKQLMREYLASVAGMDRGLGRILDRLDALGLARNTLVIFTSDHGYNIGHHGLWHKGNAQRLVEASRGESSANPEFARPNMFDTSLRVPAIVRWPGVVAPGSRVAQTVTNLDWYPTLLAAAGMAPGASTRIYGRNALPLLKGEAVSWDNTFYGEYGQHHYVEADLRMIRTPEWKLIRDLRNPGRDELYHLAADPGETHNLIDSPDFAAQLKTLDAELTARMARLRHFNAPR